MAVVQRQDTLRYIPGICLGALDPLLLSSGAGGHFVPVLGVTLLRIPQTFILEELTRQSSQC
jgi:hypothetical protein